MAAALRGLPPVVRRDARVLILGSFPGVASLVAAQYYAHPRNQFWPILGRLLDEPLVDLRYRARLARVRAHQVAIWDVVGECRRDGSLDAAIRDPRSNDFAALLERAPKLAAVAFNGAAAARAADWFLAHGLAIYRLPSTSPANAGLGFEAKLECWRVLARDGWMRPG